MLILGGKVKKKAPDKAKVERSVEQIARLAHWEWKKNRGLPGHRYFEAVQAGFKGHQRQWWDLVLQATGYQPRAPAKAKS